MPIDPPGELPSHLADLPVDERGYRAPAEAPVIDGQPVISKIDPQLTVLLGARRACAVCGYEVADGETLYRVWADQDVPTVRRQATTGTQLVDDLSSLGHLSCMLYSALVCPHWRTAGARLGKDSMFGAGTRRGARPALFGFRNSLLMLDPADWLGLQTGRTPRMLHTGFVEEIPFTDPTELTDRYAAAVASRPVGTKVDAASTRTPTSQPPLR